MTALTEDLKKINRGSGETGGGERSLPPEDPSHASCGMAE